MMKNTEGRSEVTLSETHSSLCFLLTFTWISWLQSWRRTDHTGK